MANVLLDGGLVRRVEPVTGRLHEEPGGLVRGRADGREGKAERIHEENVESYAGERKRSPEGEGIGRRTDDTAYGGDSFVVVDAAYIGFALTEDEAHDIARLGVKITNAAN